MPGVHGRLARGRRRPSRPRAGMVAGRYLLQRQLGRGASKDVWLAHDLTLDRGVALARVSGPEAWERLRREARLTARLGGHRHIVTVHDVFEDAGTPCLVARYMTGRLARGPARPRARRGRLEPQEVIAAGREIADALAHAHAHGVVHRDVKPDNVWIDAEGEAALGDFGVAVAEGESAPPAGTPRYAAPEQTPRRRRDAALGPVRARRDALRAAVRRAAVRHQGPPADAHAGAAVEPRARRPGGARPADPRADRPGPGRDGRADAAVVARRWTRLIARAPEDAVRTAGLVGRGPELERLRRALTQAWSGLGAHGRRSPASRGSARRRCSTRSRPRPAVAAASRSAGRGEPEGRAYGVWRPVVRGADRARPRRARPGARRRCSARAGDRAARSSGCGSTTRSRTCWRRPPPTARCCVVLDDLHWADASSLRLLAHVVGAEPAARLLLAGSYTPRPSVDVPGGPARDRGRPAGRADRARRARPGGGARAAARRGRAADRRGRPLAHRGQPVLRRRARAAARRPRAGSATTAARSSPRACATSCAGASSGSARRPAPCSRSARSRAASRSPTSCAPRASPAPRSRPRSTAGPRPGS